MSDSNLSRRSFLGTIGMGTIGAMLPQKSMAASHKGLHHKPKAKRLIMLFMAGGQSQLDLFDHKPGLQKLAGQKCLPLYRQSTFHCDDSKSEKLSRPPNLILSAVAQMAFSWAKTYPTWDRHGRSLPRQILYTESINHDPGKTLFCTGQELPGNPSLGPG